MTEVAFTYGHALFELAQEEGKIEEYKEQLDMVTFLLNTVPKMLPLLSCRDISLAERLGVLDDGFGGQVEPYVLNFMKVLCQNGHSEELPDCIRQFNLLYNEHRNILEVSAVSAVALTDALKEKLQKKLEAITGKTVVLVCKEDPTVLGGLRLNLDGKELDGTVRRKLDEFGKSLADLVL